MMYGFTFYAKGKDYFVETDYKNRTERLAVKILQAMGEPTHLQNINAMLYCLRKAVCEIKTMSNGRQYYEIYGENFGGVGSFLDDGKTVILKIA